jgi:uncharacterized protein YndB with AHSA1/START domain
MEPIVVEVQFKSTADAVWNAITREEELKKWYFDVQCYHPEVGNEFHFHEPGGDKYLHRCRVTSFIPGRKISYTWAYPAYSKGISEVSWEIILERENAILKLTHEGIEQFANAGLDFSRESFEAGWNSIVKNQLRNYLYGIKKLVFQAEMQARPEKVWQALWGKQSYSDWTAHFCPGSYYSGEMKQGTRIHFLTPSGEGIYSDIGYLKENKLMIISHIGYMHQNQELPMDEATRMWTGSYETYILKEVEGKTLLTVEVDTLDEYIQHMNESFPKALARLKEIAES